MSQKVSRKTVNEEKDKRSTNSPVKEMKKKMAANAEKEKQAAVEKTDKADKTPEKPAEKQTEKPDKSDKTDKSEKHDKSVEKKSEKKDHAEKKNEKPESQAEKSKEESSSKEDKVGKTEKEKPESKKPEPSKQKQNSRDRVHNGVSDVTLGNGEDVLNGTVSADSEDDDAMLVIDDHDELFPELTYDDTSDVECFEPPTPENVPSRSLTRRSQVKAARTPETPRPEPAHAHAHEPKDAKVLKLKDDAPATERKLRSADSPKPETKKQDSEKKAESDKKQESDKKADSDKKQESEKKAPESDKKQDLGNKDKADKEIASKDVVGDKTTEGSKSQEDKVEIEIVVEVEANDGDEVQRKTDTNYSKSRVKVSPYRRSMRIADQTNTSVLANYTGNNTTMEMDITETSSLMEDSNLDDSSYLRGLRSIRGRSSYKPLKELTLKHVANRSTRSNISANLSGVEHGRPTGTVVGRKRKPDPADSDAGAGPVEEPAGGAKRLRVLERLAEPFRRYAATASLPATHRRNAPIVGINTDLPLSAPVAAEATFDPESLKTSSAPALAHASAHDPAHAHQPDNKRCVLM